MAEYSKMKNADLEALLKSRGLPTGGKKADMVERLTKDDEKKAASAEDQIDWDDDEDAVTEPPKADASKSESSKPVSSNEEVVHDDDKATNPAAAAAINAGGKGPVANPQAVPNQVADIDPSKTNDLTVKSPEKDAEAVASEQPASTTSTTSFARGLPASDLDKEIEKRKARALRFGLDPGKDETLKKLERAKKFGSTEVPKGLDDALADSKKRGRAAETPKGLDEALPLGKKRGREGGNGGNSTKRRRSSDDRRPTPGRSSNRPADQKRDGKQAETNGRSKGTWMSEEDKAKAAARQARFAAPQ